MRLLISAVLASLADWLRPSSACPNCFDPKGRPNTKSGVKGAMLCDTCGCRWRP